MADLPSPTRGTIVTYRENSAHGAPICRAVACGTEIVDPDTQGRWLPVLRPHSGSTIVDAALIVAVGRTGRT